MRKREKQGEGVLKKTEREREVECLKRVETEDTYWKLASCFSDYKDVLQDGMLAARNLATGS